MKGSISGDMKRSSSENRVPSMSAHADFKRRAGKMRKNKQTEETQRHLAEGTNEVNTSSSEPTMERKL